VALDEWASSVAKQLSKLELREWVFAFELVHKSNVRFVSLGPGGGLCSRGLAKEFGERLQELKGFSTQRLNLNEHCVFNSCDAADEEAGTYDEDHAPRML
jgi:hypothetical protein